MHGQQARPSTSFVANTMYLPAKFLSPEFETISRRKCPDLEIPKFSYDVV